MGTGQRLRQVGQKAPVFIAPHQLRSPGDESLNPVACPLRDQRVTAEPNQEEQVYPSREAMPNFPEASAWPLHLHSDQDPESPRRGSPQPWGPGGPWTTLEADSAEEKLPLRVAEQAERAAAARACWWEPWLQVSRAGQSECGPAASLRSSGAPSSDLGLARGHTGFQPFPG